MYQVKYTTKQGEQRTQRCIGKIWAEKMARSYKKIGFQNVTVEVTA